MQERAAATRQSVLIAAAQLFEQRGYAATSIADVAKASGYTSGAIYFHFASKEDLAFSLVEEHFARWPPLVEKSLACDASALDRLVCLSFVVAREFRDDLIVRAGNRLWTEHRSISTELPRPFVGWIATVTEFLALARRQEELLPHVDVARAARVIISAFFGTHTVSDALCNRRDIEASLADLWLLLLPALRPTPATGLREQVEQARLLLDGPSRSPRMAPLSPAAGTSSCVRVRASDEPR